MSQLKLWSRAGAVPTQAVSLSRHSTQWLETGSGWRDLSRGGKSRPQRRTTSSSDQPLATSGSSRDEKRSIARFELTSQPGCLCG